MPKAVIDIRVKPEALRRLESPLGKHLLRFHPDRAELFAVTLK